MNTFFGILGGVILIYLLLGVGLAFFEASQTGDSFQVKTIVTWLYKIFK